MKYDALRLKALAAYSLLRARARAEYPSELKLDALASAAVLYAASKGEQLTVAVKAQLLAADAKTGRFFQLLDLADTFAALETHYAAIGKLRQDEVAAVDRALQSFVKSRSDATVTSEVTAKGVSKALATSFASFATDLTHSFGKRRDDNAYHSDTLTTDVHRVSADTVVSGDVGVVAFDKHRTDSAATADFFSRVVAYIREFSDETDATDAISLVALTDDGQVMYMEKVVFDPTWTSETLSYDLSALREDSFTASEQAVREQNKPRFDEVSFSDQVSNETGKVREDSVSLPDFTSYFLAAARSDEAIATEVLVRSLNKTLSDTVSVADYVNSLFETTKQDSTAISDNAEVVRIAAEGVPPQSDEQAATDVYAPHFYKLVAETLVATDDFDGEATTEDDQTTAFIKSVGDAVASTEYRIVTIQKPSSDTVATNDSGFLFATNYCDSTYFSQGYVGQERTFT